MSNLNIVTLKDIKVARVKSQNGTIGASKAFNKLESRMNGLKGRKMFGLYYPDRDTYYACVRLDSNFNDNMGFEQDFIPKGLYSRKNIKDWVRKVTKIKDLFKKLENESKSEGYKIDPIRPRIEFYRSQKELIIMLPITKI